MSLAVRILKTAYKNTGKFAPKSKTKTLATLFKERKIQPARTFSGVTAMGTEQTEQVVIKEHGLSEIMSESAHTPTKIGQTPVYSPLKPELPERYIKVEGQVIPYEFDYMTQKFTTSYKITPEKPNEYIELFETRHFERNGEMVHERVSLGQGKKVQFYNEKGEKVGAVIKVPRTSKMTKEEYLEYLEDLKKKPKLQPIAPAELQQTCLEKTINGLQAPKGTVQKLVRLDNEGNTIVRFLDKDDSFIRKIKLNPDGHVMEYTDFRTLIGNNGLEYGGFLSCRKPGLSFSRPLNGEIALEEAGKFDELISRYTRIREQTRYILDSNGEVARSIQTRRFTPHEYGRVGETPVITTVDARSMGGGKFVEDVVITKGDKRFSRSFWFDQKSGNVHTMDGWCKGLTKEELQIIKSDPFLASRYFNDGLDFVRVEKFNAYKTQGLRDKQTPLTFDLPNDDEFGYYAYRKSGNRINLTPSHVKHGKARVVNTMHHEPRHGFQHQMAEDLDKGLLQGEEATQAQVFKDNFANYKSPKDGFDAYYEQAVEVDARKAGEGAQKQFVDNGKKIECIFFGVA